MRRKEGKGWIDGLERGLTCWGVVKWMSRGMVVACKR